LIRSNCVQQGTQAYSLLSILEKEVIPELKKLAGKDKRVTLVFDREGWSPRSFEKWFKGSRKNKFTFWHLIFRSFLADFKEQKPRNSLLLQRLLLSKIYQT